MSRCECCDHPLQHAIRWAIARYDAPIPPPSARELVEHLRSAVSEWETEEILRFEAQSAWGPPEL